mgnify:CR=1 FL=1|jgi:lysophospholipase L1-like esterase
MSFKYYLGFLFSIPLLPILYFDGKKIRKNVPRLLEAKNPKGYIKKDVAKTLKLLIIGESTIAGVGVDYHKTGFAGTLAKTLAEENNVSVLWRVYAKSGYTAKLIRKRLLPQIEDTTADIIVIGLGGNDAFNLNSPGVWILQINLLIKKLKRRFPKTPIYFTNMPPIKEFPAFTKSLKFVIGNLVEVLGKRLHRNVKRRENVYYNNEVISLDSWSEKYNLDNDISTFFSDGVHPSKLTYQIWGKDMAHYIMQTKNFKQWTQND